MIILYGTAVAVYLDGLTKSDLMILLGTFLLGHYVGSKKNAASAQADV